MKPYGWKHAIYFDEEYAPPSSLASIKSAKRRRMRRALHKKARNAASRWIRVVVKQEPAT